MVRVSDLRDRRPERASAQWLNPLLRYETQGYFVPSMDVLVVYLDILFYILGTFLKPDFLLFNETLAKGTDRIERNATKSKYLNTCHHPVL